MRQTGILAAAGIHAVEHHVEQMAEDHTNARVIADVLRDSGLDVRTPRTNIVLVDVPDAAPAEELCAASGVRISSMGPRTVRLVTHLDVDSRQCAEGAVTLATAVSHLGAQG